MVRRPFITNFCIQGCQDITMKLVITFSKLVGKMIATCEELNHQNCQSFVIRFTNEYKW